jgi:formiminotetrahydrofolate cyclodeaminase
MSNEQIKQSLDEIKVRFRDGILDDPNIYTALMKVSISIEASRKEKKADRTRKILDALHSDTLQLCYLFFLFTSRTDIAQARKDVLTMIYTVEQEGDEGDSTKISDFEVRLKSILLKKYPNLRQRTLKSKDELK